MADHTHTTLVDGCFRCELNRDEIEANTCDRCGHGAHDPDDCDEETGYDHLNGPHECDCSGECDEPRPACTCAMSENSMRGCEAHGEQAFCPVCDAAWVDHP